MPRNARVFVVQEPLIMRGSTPTWKIPRHTLEEYGDVVCLFSWGELKAPNALASTRPFMMKLREKLADISDIDYIAPIGNPALIAMTMLVACEQNNGVIRVLDWIRNEERYRIVNIDLYDRPVAKD